MIPRLGVAVIGQGLERNNYLLFRKLRPHGAYFTHVNPGDGLQELLTALAERAGKYSAQYGHWYIDGGQPQPQAEPLTTISYGNVSPVRAVLLRKMQAEIQKQGMGPVAMRTILARMKPEDLFINADMGAHYNWVGQQRLSGAQQPSFLVWCENHSEAGHLTNSAAWDAVVESDQYV